MKLFSLSSKRNTQVHLLSKAVQLEETVEPSIARLTMLSCAGIVFAFIVWCAFAELNELARTSGTIEPVGQERLVQHPDGGVVGRLHVREGQTVRRGELLVTLSGENLQKDLSRAKRRLRLLQIDEVRLRAYVRDEKPDFTAFGPAENPDVMDANANYASQVAALADRIEVARLQRNQRQNDLAALCDQFDTLSLRLASARELYDIQAALFEDGLATKPSLEQSREKVDRLVGEINVISNRIESGREAIVEYDRRIDATKTEDRAINFANLNAVIAQVSETVELVEKLEKQVSRLEIQAPVDGVVKGLKVVEPGEVILSAMTIARIVPSDEDLVARVRISPSDIGHLRVGLPVQIKVSAYDFGRYGAIEGRLTRLSPGTFRDEKGGHYYSGEIALDRTFVGSDPRVRPLAPGMLVSADIVTGSKSILQYLMQPVYASLSVALSER